MSKTVQCRESLIRLLEAHTASISAANAFLVNIKNAIRENKLDNLGRTLSSSNMAVEEIEQLEQQRHQLLAEYGFSTDFDGFESCISWCDNDAGQVSKLYQGLVQGLEALQHSIQVNSLLVSKGRDRVRRSIGILTGLGAGANHKTYSRSGKTELPIGQRDIAIA